MSSPEPVVASPALKALQAKGFISPLLRMPHPLTHSLLRLQTWLTASLLPHLQAIPTKKLRTKVVTTGPTQDQHGPAIEVTSDLERDRYRADSGSFQQGGIGDEIRLNLSKSKGRKNVKHN